MKQILMFWLLLVGTATADIEVKPQYEANEPIAVSVTVTDVPAGAKLRGSFSVSDGSYLPAGENTYHLWCGPGKHTVTSQGVWVLTQDVKVGDQVVPALIDFGQYQYTKTFVVGQDVPPVPPPTPTPPGPRKLVVLKESGEQLPVHNVLYQQLLKEFPGILILDKDLPLAKPFLSLYQPTSLPALLVLTQDNQLVRGLTLPSSVADVKKELLK